MRKLLFAGRWINAEEIERIGMSWGADYFLYKDESGRFYATLCDGMPDVIELCNFEQSIEEITEETAKKAFKEYIQRLEDEQTED